MSCNFVAESNKSDMSEKYLGKVAFRRSQGQLDLLQGLKCPVRDFPAAMHEH